MPKRKIVIIGGGLSGLAAAYELENQKPSDVEYSLIEVKPRLGGSLETSQENGLAMDGTGFASTPDYDPALLADLQISGALLPLDSQPQARIWAQGAQMLVDALAARVQGARLMRMAVSSVGELEDGRCGICLENGLLLAADALLLAVPAYYAERMFYGYIRELSDELRDFHYDQIVRVNLTFTADKIPETLTMPPDVAYVYAHQTRHPARVPAGKALMQVGMRVAPELRDESSIIDCLCADLKLPTPQAAWLHAWDKADPLTPGEHDFAERMRRIRTALPPRIALTGSDYLPLASMPGVAALGERIEAARQAARELLVRVQS